MRANRLGSSRSPRISGLWLFGVALLAAGCVGRLGGEDPGGSASTSGGPTGGAGGGDPNTKPVAEALPLNRLSTSEYDRTIRDLLKLDPSALGTAPSAGFPGDDIVEKYAVGYSVSALEVERAESAAERLAGLAMAHPERILPCDPKVAGEDACATSFIDAFGKRAYRRPLTDEEKADLFATYQFGKTNGAGFNDGIELVVQAALLSPYFLFHVPALGDEASGAIVDVVDWEMASRLSYFLWGTMPDDALLTAAEAGLLRTPEQTLAQAERLFADPRAKEAIGSFLEQTFQPAEVAAANRDPSAYPMFNGGIARSLSDSYRTFLDDAFWNGGKFDDFFRSRKVFVNADLAPIYGFSGVTGTTLAPVQGAEGERLGILTQPGFLTLKAKFDRSDPIHRGVFIVKNVLCRTLGDPPANAASATPDPNLPQHTTRQQIEAKTANSSCQSCHGVINPLGFGLESFDAIGRFRKDQVTDAGTLPIDPSGSGNLDGTKATTWSSAAELANAIASSTEARRCFAQNLYRFANPRGARPTDGAEIDAITSDFVAGGEKMHDLVLRVVKSPAFTKRLVP